MKFGRKHVILAVALFSLVCVVGLYVAQARYGICIKEGRVLSSEELRQRVLLNLVNLEIKNVSDNSWFVECDLEWVGIANSVSEVDIKRNMEKIFSSDDPIEKNLGLKRLVKPCREGRSGPYSASQLKEPFILVKYEKINSEELGWLYTSSNIKEVDFLRAEGQIKKQKQSKEFLNIFNSFYNGLCGYNNHYYIIDIKMFWRRCCDREPLHERLKEERRREDFEAVIKQMDSLKITRVAAISNCGEILTEPSGMGTVSRNIRWVR